MNHHRILAVAQMREADRLTIASGVSGMSLMESAGAGVAQAARAMLAPTGRVVILCGPGNNGGDGFIAARRLAEDGYRVTLGLVGPREALSGDAGAAAALYDGPAIPLEEITCDEADLVIDALFGTGLARGLEGAVAACIARVAQSGVPVLAVDIPSGIDGDSGTVRGVTLPATRTVTFAARKPGHLLLPGRDLCGVVSVVDIGIPDATRDGFAPALFANEPALWRTMLPHPKADTHKYQRGHGLVLSGEMHRTGAARLAARGALRSGAGAVTLASPRVALAVNAAHLTAIMLAPCDTPEELGALLEDLRFTAVALGPGYGVGEATRAMVKAAARAGRGLVLDADALTSFAGEAYTLGMIATAARACVLTPHEGEMRRLFESAEGVLDAPNRWQAALRAAEIARSVMICKGGDTIVASPDGRAAILAETTPYLATAGSGDVLTGIVTGLLTQGMPAFEAACAAVWLHARAGIAYGPGLIAEDLSEALPGVLRGM
ncbi:NAD(P)H-hydrate dehydratase [Saliniramus sp.]|uniref:NAD(P)H-hydrate dehydratase n=1 Tax=Saliniramus sp. TaxID=2986772 RepID=UPI002CB934B5|nr:NAD(P)H-hydrate dehydratase [Saliniramus sp.]HMB11734.1 NAD(P)H-hydrate dehydratase [Saliniramus sp.]